MVGVVGDALFLPTTLSTIGHLQPNEEVGTHAIVGGAV